MPLSLTKSSKVKIIVTILSIIMAISLSLSDTFMIFIDDKILVEFKAKGFSDLVGTSEQSVVSEIAADKNNPNLLFNQLSSYNDPAGFSVTVNQNGSVDIAGTNNSDVPVKISLAQDIRLAPGKYILSDGGASLQNELFLSAANVTYGIKNHTYTTIVAELPQETCFSVDSNSSNKFDFQITIVPHYSTNRLTFYPMLRKYDGDESPYYPCVAPFSDITDNQDLVRYNRYITNILDLSKMTKNDWRMFYRYIKYAVAWSNFDWLTVDLKNGNGFEVPNRCPEKILYGRLDPIGRVTEPLYNVELKSSGQFVFSDMDGRKVENAWDTICNKSLPLNQISDIYSYLNRLQILFKDSAEYTVLISVFDEGTSALDNTLMEELKNLGINTQLISDSPGAEIHSRYLGSSYYAVLEPGQKVHEEVSDEVLTYSGITPDDKPYSIVSGGWNTGAATASITLNGEEWGMDRRGMNIVVYDNKAHQVIDTVCFDTYSGLTCYRS